MVKEEQEHDLQMAGKNFNDLSKTEQIQELIYQLRTQNGFLVTIKLMIWQYIFNEFLSE